MENHNQIQKVWGSGSTPDEIFFLGEASGLRISIFPQRLRNFFDFPSGCQDFSSNFASIISPRYDFSLQSFVAVGTRKPT